MNNKSLNQSQALSSTLLKGSYLKTPWSVSVYSGTLRFCDVSRKPKEYNRYPRSKRSTCQAFTKSSRLRMMKMFNRLRFDEMSQAFFVTLTYHYGHAANPQIITEHRNEFLTRLRQLYPSCKYVWRLELQKRGAPHLHLMFWGDEHFNPLVSKSARTQIRQLWHKIADPESQVHLQYGIHIQPCTTQQQVMKYVCKYVAKEDEQGELNFKGRRWGASKNLPLEPYLDFEVGYKTWDYMREVLARRLQEKGNTGWLFDKLLQNEGSIEIFLTYGESVSLITEAITVCKDKNRDAILRILNST